MRIEKFILCFSLVFSFDFHGEIMETKFIPIDEKHQMFYWLFKSRSKNPNAPLVLWLEGGPGCSSGINVMEENGPYRLGPNLTILSNPYSWNNDADLLMLDQPIGTGYSNYSDISRTPLDEKGIVKDLMVFFEKFLESHEYYRKRDFYIASHSYGGHYVPYLTDYLLKINYNELNLKGVIIGNGAYKFEIQVQSYIPFEKRKGLIYNSLSYIGSSIAFRLVELFAKLKWGKAATQFFFLGVPVGHGVSQRYSMYDIREKPGSHKDIQQLYNNEEFQKAIGVYKRNWLPCNMKIFLHMSNDVFDDMSQYVKSMLEARKKIKVIIYTGVEDWICNSDGMDLFMKSLEWDGKKQFEASGWKTWSVSGKNSGRYKKIDNFAYYEVEDTGHMICEKHPELGYSLLNDLISD